MANRIFVFLILLSSIVTRSFSIDVDVDLTVPDRRNWIDVNEPLAIPGKYSDDSKVNEFGANTCTTLCDGENSVWQQENEMLREQIMSLKTPKERSVDALLKHILREFMTKLNVDVASDKDVYKTAQIVLSAENLRLVRRYLASTKISEEFGLREDIRFALENFLAEVDRRSDSSLFSVLHFLLPYVTLMNILVLPAALLIVIRSIFSIRQLFILILVTAFFISLYFTYAKKYQEVLAQRFERLDKNSAKDCTPQGLMSEAYNVLLSYIRIKEKSECLKSYEDVLIEPFLLVDPLQVVAEVCSNFFLSPLSIAGVHLNKFFNDFFINTPIHLFIVKGLFLLLLGFYITGYRVRTFLATVEPAESFTRLLPHALTTTDFSSLRLREIADDQQNSEDFQGLNDSRETQRYKRLRRSLSEKVIGSYK